MATKINSAVYLKVAPAHLSGVLHIPSSKSESNRCLILQAIANQAIHLSNLSSARDTQTMIRLLASSSSVLDVLDAGTTMRFLTAYCTVVGQQVTLTGSPRMQSRPIGILVDALRTLGGIIEYVGKEGFPPLQLKGFAQKTNTLRILGNVSSQYISALLLITPLLEKGLMLDLEGTITSRPYITLTLELLKKFGIQSEWEENTITVTPQELQPISHTIESDWSSASYWYAMSALSEKASLEIRNMQKHSLQGDSQIAHIMQSLGVTTDYKDGSIFLKKAKPVSHFKYDFSDCPDLSLTIAVLCAAQGIQAELYGLHTLPIKECNRLTALQIELSKLGVQVEIQNDNALMIKGKPHWNSEIHFSTYEDHRMAMALAMLCKKTSIVIESPEVVAKSYPSFWEDMSQLGFSVEKRKV